MSLHTVDPFVTIPLHTVYPLVTTQEVNIHITSPHLSSKAYVFLSSFHRLVIHLFLLILIAQPKTIKHFNLTNVMCFHLFWDLGVLSGSKTTRQLTTI
jgi:hypothetical protein